MLVAPLGALGSQKQRPSLQSCMKNSSDSCSLEFCCISRPTMSLRLLYVHPETPSNINCERLQPCHGACGPRRSTHRSFIYEGSRASEDVPANTDSSMAPSSDFPSLSSVLESRATMNSNVIMNVTGHAPPLFFATDCNTGLQFLANTGAEVNVFPANPCDTSLLK